MSDSLHDALHTRCPRCGENLNIHIEKCDNCEFTCSGVKLYNPKYFILLAALLSGLVTIFLAASNYGRLGRDNIKRRMLFWGFIGYLVIFTVLMLMPETDETASRYIGWVINLPVGYYLWYKQKSLYETALSIGANRESLLKGGAKGLGLVVCAFLIPLVAWIVVTEFQINQGESLIEQEKYEEASIHFERLYASDSEDPDIVSNLAVCYIFLEEWDKAAHCLKTYIESNEDDASAHAMLGYVRDVQGYDFLAEQYYMRAEELSPGIMNQLLNPDSLSE